MSTKTAYLTLLLDAPMQSWGFESRFQRRTTGMYPTKSGVIGMICAAMGHVKRPVQEDGLLRQLAALKMTIIAFSQHGVRRLEDYHTVGAAYDPKDSWERLHITRKANSTPEKLILNVKDGIAVPVVTNRQYLFDARFGVILEGDSELLERVAGALRDPCWGVWFGRKSCIPAGPICRGFFASAAEAENALIGNVPLESFTAVTEAETFAEGTDSLADQPVSFGDGTSSGPDKRQFAIRRIKVQPGVGLPAKG